MCAMLANACPSEPRSSPGICRLAGASVSELSDVFSAETGVARHLTCWIAAPAPWTPATRQSSRLAHAPWTPATRRLPESGAKGSKSGPAGVPAWGKVAPKVCEWSKSCPSWGARLGRSGTESDAKGAKVAQMGCQPGAKWHRSCANGAKVVARGVARWSQSGRQGGSPGGRKVVANRSCFLCPKSLQISERSCPRCARA